MAYEVYIPSGHTRKLSTHGLTEYIYTSCTQSNFIFRKIYIVQIQNYIAALLVVIKMFSQN